VPTPPFVIAREAERRRRSTTVAISLLPPAIQSGLPLRRYSSADAAPVRNLTVEREGVAKCGPTSSILSSQQVFRCSNP